MSRRRPVQAGNDSRWISFAIGMLAFAVYLAQSPPVSGDKDSGEFTLVLALGGVAHPTGYPLFTLLGWAWTTAVHTLGATWAYAANSWTALGGGVAMYALHRLGLAMITGRSTGTVMRHFLAAVPVAWMVFDPIWTYETTLAEVYAWHLAWALTAATVFVWTMRAPMTKRRAALWGLLCGIGAVHHATFIFVALPLSVVLAWHTVTRGQTRPSLFAWAAAGAILPLLTESWILLRGAHPGPAVFPMLHPGLPGLIEHMTGRIYGRLLGGFHPSVEQVGMLRAYLWPLFVPALLALVVLFVLTRERRTVGALLVATSLCTLFAFRYGAVDPSSYFLVPLALALASIGPLLARLLSTHRALGLALSLVLSVTAIVCWVPWNATANARVRLYEDFDRYVGSMWHSIPFDTAFVFWANDMHTVLLERQALDHDKPGLVVLHPLELMSDMPRGRFRTAYGFDPWTPGAAVLDEIGRRSFDDSTALVAADSIEAHVNAMTPWPVIEFDPRHSSVRLLRKP